MILKLISLRTSITMLAISSFLACLSALSITYAIPIALLLSGLSGVIVLLNSFTDRCRFIAIIGASTLSGYGLGAFNTYLKSRDTWADFESLYTVDTIALAVIALNIFGIVSIFLSTLKSDNTSALLSSINQKIVREQYQIIKFTNYISISIAILQLLLIASGNAMGSGHFGDLGNASQFSDTTEASAGKLYLQIAYPLASFNSSVLGIMLAFRLSNARKNVNNYILLVAMLSNFIWLFLSGRRGMLFGIIIMLLTCSSMLSRSHKKKLFSAISLKKILSISIVLLVVSAGWDFFLYTRIFSYSYVNQGGGVIDFLQSASISYFELLTAGSDSDMYVQFREYSSNNLSQRTFIFNSFTSILKVVNNSFPLFGRDFFSSFLYALPSNFLVDKSQLLGFESLYNSVYNFSFKDIANSYLTSSFVDFSWIGLIIYPLGFYFVFNNFILLLIKTRSVFFQLIGFSTLCQICLSATEATMTFPAVNLRNTLFLMVLFVLLRNLKK